MNLRKTIAITSLMAFVLLSGSAIAQNLLGGQVHGSFQSTVQLYNEDTLIGANPVPEKLGNNTFMNMIYTNGNFEAGMRYEVYFPPLEGFDPGYEGHGFANRYIKYSTDKFEFTAGNFYEQFGSGMVLRAYEEWNLGFDNSIDGFRAKYKTDALTITGLIGKQRYLWDQGEGIIRGIDVELSVNDMFKKFDESKTRVFLGGSFVSRFQSDQDPLVKYPENVGAASGRLKVFRGGFNFSAEMAYKCNDPNATNGLIYKDGNATLLQFGYSQKGFGFNLQAKRTDNMDFRSERSAVGFNLPVNYIPSITTQHAYTLAAFYPNATQANGEMGLQASLFYKIKKKTKLGGKYGTNIDINYSIIQSIHKEAPNDSTEIGEKYTDGYKSDFFKLGDEKYYHDFNIKISRKLNKKWKLNLMYANIFYNMEINEGHHEPNVLAHIAIADAWWKFAKGQSLHFETQALFTDEDDGSWALGMIEYNRKGFFAAIMDQYNYGNEVESKRIHYFSVGAGYTYKATRVALSYGKQRQGILCVGGVCREVPASNGVTLTITSSF